MMRRLLSFIAFIGLFLVSCSSMKLTVLSNPEKAKVYLQEGKKLVSLGETPLNLDADKLGDKDSYNLIIKKQGFEDSQVLIEKRTLSSRGEIFASLKRFEPSGSFGFSAGSDSNIQQRSLATIQSQLLQKQYINAEQLARAFVDENPYSAVGWNLLGNSYLLQNRHQEAMGAYSKALEFDPQNVETQKMIEYLKFRPNRRDR